MPLSPVVREDCNSHSVHEETGAPPGMFLAGCCLFAIVVALFIVTGASTIVYLQMQGAVIEVDSTITSQE